MTTTELPDFDALWNYDDPAATEAHFRALLPLAEQAADQEYYRELLTQIARTEGLQRKFATAHGTLDTVAALLTPSNTRAQIRYELERGRVFNSAGDPAAAQPLFQAAWERATQAGEEYHAVDAAHMLAIVAPPAEQVVWHRQALTQAEAARDPRARKWRGSLYNNMGWTYHDAGQYEKALDAFEQALACYEADDCRPEIRIARWTIARALRSLGRVPEALAMQEALLAEHTRNGTVGGYVYEELGECHLALGAPETARPYFAQAYAILAQDPWLVANEPDRLARLQALG